MKGIVRYLDQLGITTIYCAPFFQSRCGSNHGYDVINPHLINPELGTLEELQELTFILANRKMGWLQDIVPNHMAYDHTNVWLRDIFEKGIHSDYVDFFDIDWKYGDEKLKGKVLMPFLGEPLKELLDKRAIKLEYNQQGLFVVYGDTNYPLSWSSYYNVFSYGKDDLHINLLEHEYNYILEELKTIHVEFTDAFTANEAPQLKEKLYQLYQSDEKVNQTVDAIIKAINENPDALQAILDLQYFVLVPYDITDHTINYRRFFIVNELICLRMENQKVFSHYHQFLKTLIDQNIIHGLRVDHIDGLAQPTQYLKSLRDLAGKDMYIIVEKILEAEETMPSYWPTQGTSGYEFLSTINHLYTKQESKDKLTSIYNEFTGSKKEYDELVFEKKFFILTQKMNGELDNLVKLFITIDPEQNNNPSQLKEALSIFLACFSVYRTYVDALPMYEEDLAMLESAFTRAENRRPDLKEWFQSMRNVLLVNAEDDARNKKLEILIRFQQFTGPLAAKGIEDTVFYIYNRLISHNEVGDCPSRFGMTTSDFHLSMKQRLKNLPLSINATSTHDTKRGEDARMRINVLSEIPDAWAKVAMKWKAINAHHKFNSSNGQIPDANDEYFIYQSLLGGFPAESKLTDDFLQRFKDFIIKAIREARIHTNWSKPDEEYEQKTILFVESILKEEEFMDSFLPFYEIVKHYGMILSLGQTLIKITAPGIPDTFQGAELWDLNFVDPDNRRTIDFGLRQNYLSNIIVNTFHGDKLVYLKQLMDNAFDGRIKLYTTWVAMNTRRENLNLFQYGEYVSLHFTGIHSDCLIGYARKLDGQWSITIAPKEAKEIGAGSSFPLGEIWKDTIVLLPPDAPDLWYNTFTGEEYQALHYTLEEKQPESSDAPIDATFSNQILIGKRLLMNQVFANFPIALLKNTTTTTTTTTKNKPLEINY